METTVEKVGEIAVVTLRGEHIDASNADDFRRDIGPVLEANTKVVFDMTPLRFVDSAGLGALLSCLRRLSAGGGDLKLFGLSKPVRGAFDVARMHRIFDIFATREEAVAAFEAEREKQ